MLCEGRGRAIRLSAGAIYRLTLSTPFYIGSVIPTHTKSAIKNFQYFFLFLHLFTSVISGYLSSGQKNQNITEKRLISYNQGKELVIEYPELEGTHKDYQVQLLALCRTTSDSSPSSESIVQTFLEFQLLSPLLPRVCSMPTTLR